RGRRGHRIRRLPAGAGQAGGRPARRGRRGRQGVAGAELDGPAGAARHGPQRVGGDGAGPGGGPGARAGARARALLPGVMMIALLAEGCYPYVTGGVSTWCDQLVRGMPEHDFEVIAIAGTSGEQPAMAMPDNVRAVRCVPLW